jgi:hypothetical protein
MTTDHDVHAAALAAANARAEAERLKLAAGAPDAVAALADQALARREADELIAGYDQALGSLDPAVLDQVRSQYQRNAGRHLAALAAAGPDDRRRAVRDAEAVVKHDPDPDNRRRAATYLLTHQRRSRG